VPAPVDTTGPFTVAAWVCLHEPRLEGGAKLGAAVSQAATSAMTFPGRGRGAVDVHDEETRLRRRRRQCPCQRRRGTPDGATWVHLGGVHDPEAGLIHLYVDGEHAEEAGFTTPWRSDGPLVLGRGPRRRACGVPPGAVADVRLYDKSLGRAEVDAMFEGTRPTTPPPPGVPDDSPIPAGEYAYTYTAEESARLQELFGAEAEAAGFPGMTEVRLRFSGNQW
jgi:hypothetical protein